MKTWLKGGLIGISLGVLWIVLWIILAIFCQLSLGGCSGIVETIYGVILVVIAFPWILIIRGGTMIYFILFFGESFLIGAIIGWIVGKVKNRNSVQSIILKTF